LTACYPHAAFFFLIDLLLALSTTGSSDVLISFLSFSFFFSIISADLYYGSGNFLGVSLPSLYKNIFGFLATLAGNLFETIRLLPRSSS